MKDIPEFVEIAARHICMARLSPAPPDEADTFPWDVQSEGTKNHYRKKARALLAELDGDT